MFVLVLVCNGTSMSRVTATSVVTIMCLCGARCYVCWREFAYIVTCGLVVF